MQRATKHRKRCPLSPTIREPKRKSERPLGRAYVQRQKLPNGSEQPDARDRCRGHATVCSPHGVCHLSVNARGFCPGRAPRLLCPHTARPLLPHPHHTPPGPAPPHSGALHFSPGAAPTPAASGRPRAPTSRCLLCGCLQCSMSPGLRQAADPPSQDSKQRRKQGWCINMLVRTGNAGVWGAGPGAQDQSVGHRCATGLAR